MILLLHVKQNKTKPRKNCHPHNTRMGSGYTSYATQFECWDEQNRFRDYNVKTKKTIIIFNSNSMWFVPESVVGCSSEEAQFATRGPLIGRELRVGRKTSSR